MNSPRDIAVAIFAGGKSSRFGSSKINAKVGEIEFGKRIVDTVRNSGFLDVSLVGGSAFDASRWGVKHLEDLYPKCGPLGALITALSTCKNELLMTLPCDVPYVDASACLSLAAITDGYEVRVANAGSPQWLCSTWRKSICGLLENEFAQGERSIHQVIGKLKHEFVEISEDVLRNINQPDQVS